MITFPNAKINLGLNIVEKRPDGYHNLETVFYPIPLLDALEVQQRFHESGDPSDVVIPQGTETNRTRTDEYTLKVAGTPIEGTSEDNLIIRVYRLLQQDFELPHLNIYMYKHIPSGAGLGGGSSDAAFMMKMLNDKFRLGMSAEDMEQRLASLGADCAFFVRNKPVFATGIGDRMEAIDLSLKGYYLVLVKPDIFISTKEAFAQIHPQKPELSIREIVKRPVKEWFGLLVNDFEKSIFPNHPEIAAIKDKLYDLGALYASMTGSGSSVYGLFEKPIEHAEEIFSGNFCRQRELE